MPFNRTSRLHIATMSVTITWGFLERIPYGIIEERKAVIVMIAVVPAARLVATETVLVWTATVRIVMTEIVAVAIAVNSNSRNRTKVSNGKVLYHQLVTKLETQLSNIWVNVSKQSTSALGR